MVEEPMVYCPKEDSKVSIWRCLGGFVEQRMRCPELLEVTLKIPENYATVKCKAQVSERA